METRGARRILIVDDDRKLCRLIGDYLGPLGYEVSARHTGTEGLEEARVGDYGAVILDVMMPGMDGFEVLRELRKTSDVPVLMLTAMGEETDRIVGLETGADDYLPKTFSTRELLARLRAVMRRSQRAPADAGRRRRPGCRRSAAQRRHPHGGDRRPAGRSDRARVRDPRRAAALEGPGEDRASN